MQRIHLKTRSGILCFILMLSVLITLFAGLHTATAAQNSVTITFGAGGNWRTYLDAYTNKNANALATSGTIIADGTFVGPRTSFFEDKTGKTLFTVDGNDPGMYIDLSSLSGGGITLSSDYVVVVNYAVVDELFNDANGEKYTYTGKSEIFYWDTSGTLIKPEGATNASSDALTLDLNSTMNDHYSIVSSRHQKAVSKLRIDIPAISSGTTCTLTLHIASIYIGPRSGSTVKKVTYSYKTDTAASTSSVEYVVSGEKPVSVPSVPTLARASNANVRYRFKDSWTVESTTKVTTANLKSTAITSDTTCTAEYTTEYVYHFKKLTNLENDTWATSDLWVAEGKTPDIATPGTINNASVSSRKVFTGWDKTLAAASAKNAGTTYTAKYQLQHFVAYHNYKSSFMEDFDETSPNEWVADGSSPTLILDLAHERINSDGSAKYYLQSWKYGENFLTPDEIAKIKVTSSIGLWPKWVLQYRVRYYESNNTSVLSTKWVTAGTKAPSVTAQSLSGNTFVSWLLNSTAGTAVLPTSTTINASTDFYPRYLSNDFVGKDTNGFVYTRTVERFIPEGYTEDTIPDSHHQYQIKIQFYFYGVEPEGPIKIFENFNGMFTTALGKDANGKTIFLNDEYAQLGIKADTINVYRESYTGNGTFDAPIRLGAGNNGYGWEDMYIVNPNDIKVSSLVYYSPSEGNPEARKYEFMTFRFFDNSRDYLEHKTGNAGSYFRKRAPLNEVGSNTGYRYTITIDLELKRGRTIGGNNIPITFGENLPASAFDPNTGRRILADTDVNTPAHGIKFYNSDCTKLLETKPFSDTENVNVAIMYDLTPHDYYMDLYDVTKESDQIYYGLLTAVSNEETPQGRRQNHSSIYGKMFTHGNGPIFVWGETSDTLPNTDCDKARNSHVKLNYKVTLRDAHTNAQGVTYPAGTVVYQTYCYGDDKFSVDEGTTQWYKDVCIDFSKDHAVVITAIATPLSTNVDSFGRQPVGVVNGKVVGDTVTSESYFFSARYTVADYGVVITIPMQGETQYIQSNGTDKRPNYLRTPSVESGSTTVKLDVAFSAPLKFTGNSVAYSHFPKYTYHNKGNASLRTIANGITECTYETTVINPPKHRDVGVTEAMQTTVNRTIYILPATTMMYDQDAVTFLTGLNGSRIKDYTADSSPWKLTGGVYKGWQDISPTERHGYDSELIKYETSTANQDYDNNQMDFNGGSVYAHVDGSKNASGTRLNQNQYGQFTFTGTGFDLYSRTGENTGMLVAEIYNASGKKLQNILVDTYMKTFSVTSKENNVTVTKTYDTLYQIPVIIYTAPEYGTYTVKFRAYYHEMFDHYYGYSEEAQSYSSMAKRHQTEITEDVVRDLLGWEEDVPMILSLSTDEPEYRPTRSTESYKTDEGYDVYIDGIRIYNTLGETAPHNYTPGPEPTPIFKESANAGSAAAYYLYSLAGEENPKYVNLNDLLLDSSNTDWCKNLYGDEDLDTGYVEGGASDTNDVSGVLFVTGQATEKDANTDQDDIYVGIHLGMTGEVRKKIVDYTEKGDGKTYQKHYLLHADGSYLLDPKTGMKIFWYSKNGRYYAETLEWTRLTDAELYAAYGQEITFYSSKYEAIGPANEIYLTDYNGIAFYLGKNLPATTQIHISLKSITGTRTILKAHAGTSDNHSWITVIPNSTDLHHRTEMYYDFTDCLYRDADGSCYLFIQHANTGHGGIISLTGIKFVGVESITPKVNLRTIRLAEQFFEETPVDETLVLKHTLNLASDISLNYVIPVSDLEGADSGYVTVKLPIYEGSDLVGSRTVTLTPDLRGKYYYYTLDGLTAVNMNDNLEATLYVVRDGVTYVSPTDHYSIASYAYTQLNRDAVPAPLKTLCAELLRYGASAQIYKGYRTDSLADEELTEEHRSLLCDLNEVPFGSTNSIIQDHSSPTIVWDGKALDLGSTVAVKFIFHTEGYEGDLEDLCLAITYTGITGQEQTVELYGAEVYHEARGQYVFTFDGLLAAELRSALSVCVCEKGVPLSHTLVYSPDTYGSNSTGELGQLCRALYAYSDAAKAYFVS